MWLGGRVIRRGKENATFIREWLDQSLFHYHNFNQTELDAWVTRLTADGDVGCISAFTPEDGRATWTVRTRPCDERLVFVCKGETQKPTPFNFFNMWTDRIFNILDNDFRCLFMPGSPRCSRHYISEPVAEWRPMDTITAPTIPDILLDLKSVTDPLVMEPSTETTSSMYQSNTTGAPLGMSTMLMTDSTTNTLQKSSSMPTSMATSTRPTAMENSTMPSATSTPIATVATASEITQTPN